MLKFDPNLQIKIFNLGRYGPIVENSATCKYSPSRTDKDSYEIVDNCIFTGEIKLIDFVHTRSSHKLVVEDDTGVKHYMRYADFSKMMLTSDIRNGKVTETFFFTESDGSVYIVPVLGREVCQIINTVR